MTAFERALERAIRDVAFREAVLQDAARALAPYGLGADDQDRLFQHVELLVAGEEEEVAVERGAAPSARPSAAVPPR
jgi:hypothetical protein